MGLSQERDRGIRAVTNTTAPNPEAESEGIRADLIAAIWPSGTSLPTAESEKWDGRLFWHEGQSVLYVCDGTNWLAVGGTYAVPLGSFGTLDSDYEFDATGGASYVYRSGKRIDVRMRLRRKTGAVVHGETLFTIATAFRPAGVGAWPLAGVQAGSGNARVIAVVLNQSGTLAALNPEGTPNVVELNGSYFID